MTRVALAWELGGGSGHVAALVNLGNALADAGCRVELLLRNPNAGVDLPGANRLARSAAPVWSGPLRHAVPRNFGEILANFGYASPVSLRPLVDAWRERLEGAALVVCNTAPAAHLAARTLGLPSLEVAQGYNVPPAQFPAPALTDWDLPPLDELRRADRAVLESMNEVLRAFGVAGVGSIGELIEPRAMLLTYPELDLYGPRNGVDYLGVLEAPVKGEAPSWRAGTPKVYVFLPPQHPCLEDTVDTLGELGWPTVCYLRGGATLRSTPENLVVSTKPLDAARSIAECDVVISHASHTFAVQTLLGGRPALLLPIYLEQFLTMRRIVRLGAGLGIEPGSQAPDLAKALRALVAARTYRDRAAAFSARYAKHDRDAARATLVDRCLQVLERGGAPR